MLFIFGLHNLDFIFKIQIYKYTLLFPFSLQYTADWHVSVLNSVYYCHNSTMKSVWNDCRQAMVCNEFIEFNGRNLQRSDTLLLKSKWN